MRLGPLSLGSITTFMPLHSAESDSWHRHRVVLSRGVPIAG